MFPSLSLYRAYYLIILLILCAISALAQPASEGTSNTARTDSPETVKNPAASSQTSSPESKQPDSDKRPKRWLQSNELLVETPYTQERGEVQHTFAFGRTRRENWASTFTQEWPLLSEKHQLTFSLPTQMGRNDEGGRGIGDAVVEYTYQADSQSYNYRTWYQESSVSAELGIFVSSNDGE